MQTTAPSGESPERDGNPGLVALPLIIAGAVGLGFTNTGLVHNGAAAVPVLLSATSVGLLLATIWAAALRQNVNATVLRHLLRFLRQLRSALDRPDPNNWFGISGGDATQTPNSGWAAGC